MPKTYFLCGSYFETEHFHQLMNYLNKQEWGDHAVLVNKQIGPSQPGGRTPAGYPIIYNALLGAAFADPNCERAWLLGDDVLPELDTLRKTQQVLEADPTIGVIFPVEFWKSATSALETLDPTTGLPIPIAQALQEGPETTEKLFAGFACACITRAAWEAVGPMDVSLGRGYGEDLDFGIRCWKAGYRCVNYRRAAFFHHRGATYSRCVTEGSYRKEEPYEAATRTKEKWNWLWNGEPEVETMARVKGWYEAARVAMKLAARLEETT